MSRRRASVLLIAIALAGVSLVVSTTAAATRTLPTDLDTAWRAARSLLISDGWSIQSEDRAAGTMITDARNVAFRNLGLYAEGTRHLLKLTLRPAGTHATALTVDHELFWEERLLWDSRRWPQAA